MHIIPPPRAHPNKIQTLLSSYSSVCQETIASTSSLVVISSLIHYNFTACNGVTVQCGYRGMIISVPRSILRQVNCRGRREVADQNDPQTDMVYFRLSQATQPLT